MSLIWDSGLYDGSALLTLLALADWANDSGICWPSVPEIAKKSRQGERNCQYCITKLVEDGAVIRKFRTEQPSIFKINLAKFSSSAGAKIAPLRRSTAGAKNSPPGATACTGGVQSTTAGVQPAAPKPSVKATTKEPPNSGKQKSAQTQIFPANENGSQRLPQSERDSWDLRRWREKMEANAPQPGSRDCFLRGEEEIEYMVERMKRAAYQAGVTIPRLQELLRPFYTSDHDRELLERLDPKPALPFTGTSP